MTDEAIILHITNRQDWEDAQAAGRYQADTLASEGFIHCSTPEQVVSVANALYPARQDLVLLGIDPARLTAPVRYENLQGEDELFPHLYGPLNLEAVVRVWEFVPDLEGRFSLPPDLAEG